MAGIDNNTLLYLRGDSFADLSLSPKSITDTNVIISSDVYLSSVYKFNGASYIDCNIGKLSNDFTIEFFFKAENISNAPHLFAYGASKTNRIILNIASSVLRLELFNGSGSASSSLTFIGLNFNQYNHIAIVCRNNKVKMAVNGKFSSNEIDITLLDKTYQIIRFGKTIYYNETVYDFLGSMYNVAISDIARYTEDFTPPTQPYNSITIETLSQTDTNIEFGITKLGQETINKVEVLVNDIVSETYTDSYNNIDYLIDTDLVNIGNNDITIRVTYDDTYTEELSLNHKIILDKLPLETPLLDTVERVKLLTKTKQNEKDMLSSILTSKNVEVSEEDKMSDLISKVDLLGEYPYKYIYKDGEETYCELELLQARPTIGTNSTFIFTKEANYIRMYCNVSSTSFKIGKQAVTKNKIDLTNYSKIKIDAEVCLVSGGRSSSSMYISVLNDKTKYAADSNGSLANTRIVAESTNTRSVYELNITSFNGEYYISVECDINTAFTQILDFKIYKIWLEK